MTTHKNLMTLSVAAVFAVGLAACSDNGGDGPDTGMNGTPMATPLAWSALVAGGTFPPGTYMLTGVPDGVDVDAGDYHFHPGDSVTVGGVEFTCAAEAGTDCDIEIMDDGTVTVAGGSVTTPMMTAMPPEPTPVAVDLSGVTEGYNDLDAGMITIVAGQSMDHGDVTFSCAEGGDACVVTVVFNPDGTQTVMSTGGMVTAADSAAYTARLEAPTELEVAQTAASDAAGAAKTAYENAKKAADDADEARKNAATMQTNSMSDKYAKDAREYANKAKDEYDKAKAASEAAAAATDVATAVKEQIKAESAQEAAEGHETTADEKSGMAVKAANNELMIDGTVKSVGDVSIDATAGRSVVTVGEGTDKKTTVTGQLTKDKQPMAEVKAVSGVAYVQAVADDPGTEADETVKGVAYVQAVAKRDDLTIGKTVDSADDMARLMIITQYGGTKSVMVYAELTSDDIVIRTTSDGSSVMAGSDGTLGTDDDVTAHALTSVGTFYEATTAGTPPADAVAPSATEALDYSDVIAADAKGTQVMSYKLPGTDTILGTADDVTNYVVSESTTTAGGNTDVTYQHVDIMAAAAPDGPDADTDPEQARVRADLPEATDYDHIHFGVWASLGDAKANGEQELSNLGIGFVQSIGDGMTGADMPNNGTADYTGNWAAAVRAADHDGNGPISLKHGGASLDADFGKGTIDATLVGLATLKGKIADSTFSGDEATATGGGLDTDGKFDGSFSGGFYGTKAAEAGGIFDFTSKDREAGEFRGAFGATRDDDN